jgi:hypothetical protein
MKTTYPTKQEYVEACVAARNNTFNSARKNGFVDNSQGWIISRVAKMANEHYDLVVVRGIDLRSPSTYA